MPGLAGAASNRLLLDAASGSDGSFAWADGVLFAGSSLSVSLDASGDGPALDLALVAVAELENTVAGEGMIFVAEPGDDHVLISLPQPGHWRIRGVFHPSPASADPNGTAVAATVVSNTWNSLVVMDGAGAVLDWAEEAVAVDAAPCATLKIRGATRPRHVTIAADGDGVMEDFGLDFVADTAAFAEDGEFLRLSFPARGPIKASSDAVPPRMFGSSGVERNLCRSRSFPLAHPPLSFFSSQTRLILPCGVCSHHCVLACLFFVWLPFR